MTITIIVVVPGPLSDAPAAPATHSTPPASDTQPIVQQDTDLGG